MRFFVVFFIALVLAAPATPKAHAAGGPKQRSQPPPLYSLDSAPRTPTGGPVGLADAAEEYLIAIDPEAVAVNPQAFTINLPTIPPLEAVRTRFVVYRPDWKSWIGTLRFAGTQGEGTGYIHLGYHGKQVTALIHFEEERYQIVGGFWEPHRLVRLSDELSVRSCGLDDSGVTEPLTFGATSAALQDEPPVGALVSTRLDVLVVYPKVFFGFGPAAEVAVFNFAEDSISLANDIFTNGNIPAYYNLVGIVPITAAAQPPATGIYDALYWLTQQPTEVANLRNAFGADVVTIYVPYIWTLNPACGVANLPQKDYATFRSAQGTNQITVAAAFNQRAFSANRVSCGLGDFTLGHEIGHNYGMRHEDGNTSPTVHLFPFGRGYDDIPGLNKSTVMGCACGESGEPACGDPTNAVCNRIPYFSDPGTFYQNVAIGTLERNNAHVAHTQAASTTGYTTFRAQSANTPPFANFTVSCSGRTCTFNASSSTDNLTIPCSGSCPNYWWDFGDNITGTGKIVNHTYSYGTFFWVHLVVKDSGGQTDVTLNSASPQ